MKGWPIPIPPAGVQAAIARARRDEDILALYAD